MFEMTSRAPTNAGKHAVATLNIASACSLGYAKGYDINVTSCL